MGGICQGWGQCGCIQLIFVVGDLSSISGSGSSSSEEEEVELKSTGHTHSRPVGSPRKSLYLHFFPASSAGEGGVPPTHSVYRCILTSTRARTGSEVTQDTLKALGDTQVWIILMRSGGHFAGAVFRG